MANATPGIPEQQKEDSRRRQESGQTGAERLPEPVEKGDARRDKGGPGQQGDDEADAAKHGNEKH